MSDDRRVSPIRLVPADFERIAAQLAAATHHVLSKAPDARVGGGSINACFRWGSSGSPLFVKIATADGLDMFAAEAAGLEELRAADAVRVPRVLAVGADDRHAFIALEWLDLRDPSPQAERELGIRLARQHGSRLRSSAGIETARSVRPIRTTRRSGEWLAFWRDRRLGAQFSLARRQGYGRLAERGARLLGVLDGFFSGYRPTPALLHGGPVVGETGRPMRTACP